MDTRLSRISSSSELQEIPLAFLKEDNGTQQQAEDGQFAEETAPNHRGPEHGFCFDGLTDGGEPGQVKEEKIDEQLLMTMVTTVQDTDSLMMATASTKQHATRSSAMSTVAKGIKPLGIKGRA